MAAPIPDSLERLSPSDLIGVVRDLIGEVGRLRAENEKLGDALTKLKAEHEAVKDELARLKKLPPRPPQKPSGMDKATDGGGRDKSPAGETSRRRRRQPVGQADDRGNGRCEGAGAGRLAPQGLRGHRGSGSQPEPAGDALSARTLGNAGGLKDHRRTRLYERPPAPAGHHALCWVHAGRLVHKLVPANDRQRNAIAVAKRMIWWFYRSLKEYKQAPCPQQAQVLRARFDRIFKRSATGYVMLDRLLRRLFRHKEAWLRVLDRLEIPLNTNASENDIRAFVTKRKISGGTVCLKGRDARDIMLGLAKTCMKLNLPFYDFLGARLGIPGPQIPLLPKLIRPVPS
jgi:transposase IS66 family protein